MRLISRDGDDTLELRLNRGKWSDEDGVPVELEALISDGPPVADLAYLIGAGSASACGRIESRDFKPHPGL